MYAIALFFLGTLFLAFIGPDAVDLVKMPIGLDLPVGATYGVGTVVLGGSVKMLKIPLWRSYLAGCILLGIAPCTAIYFYGNGCSHCEKVKPLIADIQARYPDIYIEKLEIYDNRKNLDTFQTMGSQYGISSSSLTVPTIFIGENALIGDTEIMDHFEEYVLAEKQRNATGNSPR